MARFGAFLVVLATLFIAWRLHRHASADAPPEADAARPLIEHQRPQFVRQRDALASVALWYLLPFAPGMGLMVFAPAVERGTRGLLDMGMGGVIAVAVMVIISTGIWWLNRRGARQLQKAIDDLDALANEEQAAAQDR